MSDNIKLVIEIPKYVYEEAKREVAEGIFDYNGTNATIFKAVSNGKPLSENKCFEGMTNGEVIQALFPNISVYEHGSTYSVNNEYNFNSTWWNLPYKAESEDKE